MSIKHLFDSVEFIINDFAISIDSIKNILKEMCFTTVQEIRVASIVELDVPELSNARRQLLLGGGAF